MTTRGKSSRQDERNYLNQAEGTSVAGSGPVKSVRAALLLPLLLLLAAQASADQRVTKIDLMPPRGFRPSNTVERLVDFLATNRTGRYQYHSGLYPRYKGGEWVVTLHADLLFSGNRQERGAAHQILSLAREYGFHMRSDVPSTRVVRTLRDLGWAPGPPKEGTLEWTPLMLQR